MNLIFFDEAAVASLEMQRAFNGNVHLSARQLAPDLIASQQELDALYLSPIAAERWGPRPLLYEAQVLKTNREDNWPAFVVAGVALRPDDVRAGDPLEELKLTIDAVIDAVQSYNSDNGCPIEKVGFWTWTLGIHRLNPYEAAQIIRSIYERKAAGARSEDFKF